MVLAQQQERSLTGEAGTVINNTCICCRSGSSQSQPELQALPAPSVLPIACHHGNWLAKGKRLLVPFLQAGPAKPCRLSYWHIYQLLQSIKGANTDSLVSAKPVKLFPKCSYTPKSCIGVYFLPSRKRHEGWGWEDRSVGYLSMAPRMGTWVQDPCTNL